MFYHLSSIKPIEVPTMKSLAHTPVIGTDNVLNYEKRLLL